MKKMAMLIGFIIVASACVAVAGAQTSFREFNAESRGRGVLRLENQRDEDITNASIALRRNGDAEVRLFGRNPWTFTGRWTARDNNDVDLEITNGLGNAGAEARGRVSLSRGGGFDHLEINGRSRGQRFSVTFDSDRRDGSQSGGGVGSQSSEYVGTYRSSYTPERGTDDYKIIHVLRIKDDGSAQLISRLQNREPSLSRENLALHGRLLRDLVARKKLTHDGTWREVGRRLEVNLTSLDGDNRRQSRMVFYSRDNDRSTLTTSTWDRIEYGSLGFQFRRSDSGSDPDDNSDPGPGRGPDRNEDRLAGTYSTRLRVPDSDTDIERRLELSSNGEARLITESAGGRTGRMGFRAERELGRLIRRLEGQRSIIHEGRWQYRNNQVIVDLDNLNGQRTPASLTFDVRGNTLESVRVDQNLYGDRNFSLTRAR